METRGQWVDVFKALKEKNCQLRILYLGKLSFKNEGDTWTFPDNPQLREFFTTRPALHEGHSSAWNERSLGRNSKSYEEMKISALRQCMNDYNSCYYCNMGL